MWTMTPTGFYSAVQHNTDPSLLVVRQRAKRDAEHLRKWYGQILKDMRAQHDPRAKDWPKAKLTVYKRSDYPWRLIMPRLAWKWFLDDAAEDITYGNFKDRVKTVQGAERAAVYGRVWGVMLSLEDEDRPKATQPVKATQARPFWGTDPSGLSYEYEAPDPWAHTPDEQEYSPTEFDAVIKLVCGCGVNFESMALESPCTKHQEAPF